MEKCFLCVYQMMNLVKETNPYHSKIEEFSHLLVSHNFQMR